MSIVLWVIVVHLIELVLIGGYLLIRKNNALEKVVADQQQYIDAVSIIINNSSETIKQLDNRGAFESDDEVGTFFRNLKEIQAVLDQFNLRKN
jgi:Na+-transporting NADH:ubiquinone oxidoreductase subunit NqrC